MLLRDFDSDAPAVVTKVLLVAELSVCDPLEEAPVEDEAIEPDAPDLLTAVCPALPASVTLAVPLPETVASVAFTVPAEENPWP